MKQNWTYKKLDEVCEINYGTRVVQKNDKGSTYFVYGGGGPTFMVDRYNREDCFIVARFAMSAQCTRFVKGKFFLNDSGLSVSTKSSDLSQAFVDKALLANNDVIYSMGKGMAQRNLDMPSFRNLLIPVPPLATQSRIVSELDLLQSIIDKQKAQLKELDNLAQSIFYDMFGDPVENEKGWEVENFGEVASFKNGLNYSPNEIGNSYYIIGVGDFQANSEISCDENLTSICLNDAINEEYLLQNDDILFVRSNGNKQLIARNILVKTNNLNVTFSGFCIRARITRADVSAFFINSLLKLPSSHDALTFKGRGCNISNLNQTTLNDFSIILPPLSLQHSFAAKIESIEKQKAAISKSIEETQKLFDSTMDKYFG